jgi:hypothetical protein
MKANPTEVEKQFHEHRIAQEYHDRKLVILRHERMLRIFKPAIPVSPTETDPKLLHQEGFDPADYAWFENPRMNDAFFSVLAPLDTEHFWIQKKRAGGHNFEVEEIRVDLELTDIEAQLYRESDYGKVTVMRNISKTVFWRNSPNEDSIPIRSGIREVVSISKGPDDATDVELVGQEIVKMGQYAGRPWSDVPLEYLERAAVPFGLGQRNEYFELYASRELQRRHDERGLLEPETIPETPKEVLMCAATNARGEPCGNKGVIQVAGDWYCATHSKAVKKDDDAE